MYGEYHHGLLEDSIHNRMWQSSFSFSSLYQFRRYYIKACTSGRVECTAESASVDCNEGPDLANVGDEIVIVS